MNARITMTHLCGPLGQALAVVDNVTWLYEDKQRRLPTANEINFFFSQGLEVRPIDPLRDGELTEENLSSLLELETRRFQALQGLLIGMDAEIEDQLRIRNMRRGNRLLSDHRVSQFVERRFIRPLNGQEWDLEGARRLAHSEELLAVLRLYKIIIGPSLIRLEDEITAWALQHGYTSIERAAEIRKAYDTGLIALLATSMHDDEPSELLKRVFFAKSADWDRRLATYLVRRLVPKEPFADTVSGRLVEEDSPDLSTTTGADRLRSRIGEFLEEYNSNRSKWERERYRVDHAQAYEAALKQIEWIAMRFKSHHPEAAWGDLTKLAERQFTEGGPQKFAMSLTNLATQLGEKASVAFTLYDMAVICASEDVTVHTARAETLRALGRFEEALAAYDRTVEDFPHDAFARTGRAETLRALGRFDEALAAYDRTVEDFPHDAVARTGRAETLRALGRFDEALAAYDRTVEDFPQNAVARTGRAETLRALGRFDEALAAYDRTVEDFPQNAFARTGRAETLRALGRFEEALAAYDRTVEDFPQNAVARNGRAETLRALGRFDEALAAYDRTVEDFPQNAFARNGRAETLRALGRVEEALAAYDRTVEDFPQDAVARNGRAETLRALGRFEEALAAYDRTVEDFPQDAVARTGRAETLRALGRFDEALAAYDRIVEDFPHDTFARTGRAETLRALGRFDEALAAYDRTVKDFPQNAFARNGRAVVLATPADLTRLERRCSQQCKNQYRRGLGGRPHIVDDRTPCWGD